MEVFGLILLLLAVVPFVLPIVSLVRATRTRARVDELEQTIAELRSSVDELQRQAKAERPASSTFAPPAPRASASARAVPIASASAPKAPSASASAPKAPSATADKTADKPIAPVAPPAPSAPIAPAAPGFKLPSFELPAFDWENLIGVKLFSGIAGVALVIAAIFFLRYSMEHGWLEPPVRVVIGILGSIALLVVCELKAARQYPVTANALDAAAIAILFSTFFAAHSLWNLIPAGAAFGLLALVTAVAVMLSIRRDSLFIAVLGLLGGFATPALLSTGENRPIPLFAYLLLLNIGLAWVAYRKGWAVLSVLTVALTAIYQWGWVFKFLTTSQLSLAAGVFLLFPLVTVVGLLLARRTAKGADADPNELTFERTALIAAALPLLFSVYLAAVPAYGEHTGILFGLLLLVDAGLLAVALARDEELLHAAGAGATLAVVVLWLSKSYAGGSYTTVLWLLPLFVVFFAFASSVADYFDRPFVREARYAKYVAPLVLVAFAIFAGSPRAAAAPLPLFAVLFALVALLALRAFKTLDGPLYFIAAFFSIAAQAVWSATHLSAERLPAAIAIYTAFGLLSIAVPLSARRMNRLLLPHWGSGVVLLASLGVLLFLATGPVTPAALWGLALLIVILDAGLFIEGAAGKLAVVSSAGGVLSWIVLGIWWSRSATAIGLLPSLLTLLVVTLVMLAGHAWSYAQVRPLRTSSPAMVDEFQSGVYLALVGHLFLIFAAAQPGWATPPWPLFGAIAVATLAVSITSLYAGIQPLHAAGTAAAMTAIFFWADAAPRAPWPSIALAAGAAIAAFTLAWIRVAGRLGATQMASIAAGIVLVPFEIVMLKAASVAGAPRYEVFVVAHTITFAVLLTLTWRSGWRNVAPAAVALAALPLMNWHGRHPQPEEWMQLFILGAGIYAVFVAYPFVLGRRASHTRDPHVAAILASGLFFVAAREALDQGGFGWVVGAVPVVEGAILALLLRQLLSMQQPGARDLGRLALVAGAALAFVTVAIPVQLRQQWITIGWALEAAALAWLYLRIPHRGLLYATAGLLAVVFARLALNPEIFLYQPRGAIRIFNWYLYTYVTCAASFFLAAWFLSRTEDRIADSRWRISDLAPAGGVILLFIVLNIEIADFYATGPEIMFRFGATLAQDLTYTIGWLTFGILLLSGSIYLKTQTGRIAAICLIAVTTFKCFLYDLSSLGGLYRIGSFVGLAFALTLVSLALQRFVLRASKET